MPALAIIAFASLFSQGLIDNSRGPFFPDIVAEFGVSATRGSFFFATTSLFAFIGSFFGHRWERRFSSLHLLVAATMVFSIGFFAIGLSPNWLLLCVACAIFGLAFGALNLAQNTIVLGAVPEHRRRRMINGLHSMYALAALVAPLVASLFRVVGFNWRFSFMILAVTPWILLAAIGTRFRQSPTDLPERSHIPFTRPEWRSAWFFGALVAGYLSAEVAFGTRMVLWLRADRAFEPNAANLFMGAFFMLFLVGRIIFSMIHFPGWSNWDILRVSSFLSAVLSGLGLFVHPVFMALAGLAMAPFFPFLMDEINTLFADKATRALGFVIGFGSLSVVLMHVWVGWATDLWGLTGSLAICAAGLGLVFVALLFRSRVSYAR